MTKEMALDVAQIAVPFLHVLAHTDIVSNRAFEEARQICEQWAREIDADSTTPISPAVIALMDTIAKRREED